MPIRNQAILGDCVRETRKDQKMDGVLLFGKVIKVYPKNHSADVKIMNNQHGSLVSSNENEGKYACRILENYAGIDSELNTAYGTITPIQVGCFVVVGFINNYKSQPVILGCLHDSAVNSILPDKNDSSELYRKTSVTRMQDYFTMDVNGEFDLVHHSGAYISGRNDDIDEESFNEDDLQLSKKMGISKTPSPLDLILGVKTFTGFVKLVVKSMSGIIRLLKTNNSTLSMVEIDNNGSFRIRLQLDSNKKDSGSNYSEIKMDMKTGDLSLNQSVGDKSNIVTLNKTRGIELKSNFDISITNSKNINFTSDSTVNISAPNVNISLYD